MSSKAGQVYELIERKISPENMLLDPNNPRLKTDDFRQVQLSRKQIADEKLQSAILEKICGDEHAVGPLMISIKSQGFIELDAMLAKRLSGTDKYVILEGNRRTAAIKQLLKSPDELSTAVLTSLQSIRVKEIKCEDPAIEQSVIDSIVALRHISGPKDWQPMQRAFAIFSTYERQYREKFGRAALCYSPLVTQEVSFMLAQSLRKVREEVAIFLIFGSLQKNNYDVRSDHYSLIQLLVSKPNFASEYFHFDRHSLKINEVGLERFNKLCIEPECQVRNPGNFRELYRIYRDGSDRDLALIANRSRSIGNVLGDLNDRKRDSRFLSQAQKILANLEVLKVGDFNKTDVEAQIIFRIKGLVDRRLWPLAEKYLDDD